MGGGGSEGGFVKFIQVFLGRCWEAFGRCVLNLVLQVLKHFQKVASDICSSGELQVFLRLSKVCEFACPPLK